MYININGKYLDEHRGEMEKNAREENNESDGCILRDENDESFEEVVFDDGVLTVWLDCPLAYINIDVPLSDEQIFKMVDYLTKKGKKIQKLLNLASNE